MLLLSSPENIVIIMISIIIIVIIIMIIVIIIFTSIVFPASLSSSFSPKQGMTLSPAWRANPTWDLIKILIGTSNKNVLKIIPKC